MAYQRQIVLHVICVMLRRSIAINCILIFFPAILIQVRKLAREVPKRSFCACGILEKLTTGRCGLAKINCNILRKCMHFIRRDVCATLKLKRCYQYLIRLTKTDKTSSKNLIYQTDLIRFRRRAIVVFNCLWDLELNSSKLNSTVVRRIN